MPKTNDIKPVKLPMDIGFGKDPVTNFKNNLTAIQIKIIDGPSPECLMAYLPQFLEATWAIHPDKPLYQPNSDKVKIIQDMFDGLALPTALETIGITFQIEGISLQEVTHIIRHRTGSFSADCSGDKWWHEKDCLVPDAIYRSPEFIDRYMKLVKDSKQLYVDMIDSKQISIMDARSILTRNLETFYFMRMNIKDAIAFIFQRQDKQIQPETDNILAYKMAIALIDAIPWLWNKFDFKAPSRFYQKLARSGKATNLYQPELESDTFLWHEDDFIYKGKRDDIQGTDPREISAFQQVYQQLLDYHDKAVERAKAKLKMLSLDKEDSDYSESDNGGYFVHPNGEVTEVPNTD